MPLDRKYSLLDKICLKIDQSLRTLTNQPNISCKPYPAQSVEEAELNPAEQKHAAGLMRINHAGEICAQALYHGQSIISRTQAIQEKMQQAAIEEGDHLAWCQQRLEELGSHVSYLNPLWYAGSFCIGMVAGMVGDKWSLGFVVETERQVIKHLEMHFHLLPAEDKRSYTVLKQMEEDEGKHRDEAMACGANELPVLVKKAMAFTSKIMVKIAYWV